MYLKKKIFNIEKIIKNINKTLIESNIQDIALIVGDTKRLIWKNFIGGIFRGIGIGIGVTLISAILIYVLQKIVILNIPVIGDYVSDIVEIIKAKL